jgi:hypothetical protein
VVVVNGTYADANANTSKSAALVEYLEIIYVICLKGTISWKIRVEYL